ncbi:MAG: transporter substrate-binding domain-containing protein [Ahrensia sp.]|nr:transporter substrate-binding domain-containing protein [Ahrensia sp.]
MLVRMLVGFFAFVCAALVCAPAQAQNCANVKSGLDANRKPQNTGRDIIGKSLDEIVERGWIEFAVYEDFAPYSYKKGSKLVGVDIDVGELIAQELGVDARFRAVAAGENVDADMRFNVWKGPLIGGRVANVMLHVPYNRELACRNEQVVLNGQYFNETIAIAYSKAKYPEDPPVPAYFRFDTVGVENDTIADFYLSGIGGGQLLPQMRRYPNYEAAMTALAQGEVDAVMGPLAQLEHGLTDQLAVHRPPLPGLGASSWTLGVAVRHSWRPLSYSVDDAIRAGVGDGRMKAIFEKHGLTFTPPEW